MPADLQPSKCALTNEDHHHIHLLCPATPAHPMPCPTPPSPAHRLQSPLQQYNVYLAKRAAQRAAARVTDDVTLGEEEDDSDDEEEGGSEGGEEEEARGAKRGRGRGDDEDEDDEEEDEGDLEDWEGARLSGCRGVGGVPGGRGVAGWVTLVQVWSGGQPVSLPASLCSA